VIAQHTVGRTRQPAALPVLERKGAPVEVKVGVQNSPRELVLESAMSAEEVARTVAEQVAAGGVLTLADEKGRQIVVPVSALAFVEIGEPTVRRVGFAAE
jgi:hypothetical protein